MEKLDYYRKYNPDGSFLRCAQMQMLEIMKFIDSLCVENRIKYFLDGGSTLGAVRHKGFIPWDDDMDIALFEKDYKRLCKILLDLKSEEYVLQCQRTDSNYIFLFPKFRMCKGNYQGSNPNRSRLYKWRGIGIDIFCLQETSYKAAFLSSGMRRRLLDWTWKIKNSFIRYIITKVLFAFYYIGYPFYKFIGMFRNKGELHYALGQGWPNISYSKEWFNDVMYVPFENIMLPIPVGYEDVLSSMYGDWKRIPSDEEISKHGIHSKSLLEETNQPDNQ